MLLTHYNPSSALAGTAWHLDTSFIRFWCGYNSFLRDLVRIPLKFIILYPIQNNMPESQVLNAFAHRIRLTLEDACRKNDGVWPEGVYN
jgi:hypothetical protein